jgi:hypothetical protein
VTILVLRGQKSLEVNKSFVFRVTYKRRNRELHVSAEMFDLVVRSITRPISRTSKKNTVFVKDDKLIQLGTVINLCTPA